MDNREKLLNLYSGIDALTGTAGTYGIWKLLTDKNLAQLPTIAHVSAVCAGLTFAYYGPMHHSVNLFKSHNEMQR